MLSRLGRLTAGLLVLACASGEGGPEISRQSATATDRFWTLVERAREGGAGCGRVARRLTDTLVTLPPRAIEEFGHELSLRMAESYRWDLWAVAYVANGGASDDGFDYFRGWLLTRGRARFEEALRDPPSAVVGASRLVPFLPFECEEMLRVADDAYQKGARAPLPRSTVVPWPSPPLGKPWTEETIEQVYPGLTMRVKRQ
ncbi:MAG: DUF4240 domain-containing protein [Gemmatimonadaceae bacterium]